MKKHTILIATLAALGAQVIFGFSFMFTKLALASASPMTVVSGRYIVAFLGMTAVMLIKREKICIKKGVWKIILMSLFQPVLYFLFETYGIKLTTSAFSAIMISLIPVVAMIMGIFTLNETPRVMQYIFSALSVAGVVIMALSGKSGGTVTTLGIILLFGAVLSSAAFNITSRKISKDFSATERTWATTAVGVIVFSAIAIFENSGDITMIIEPFFKPVYLWSVIYLGFVSSVIAFLMLNFANTHLPVAKTTVFSNITTIISVIAGAMFLDEKITPIAILSTIMIICGVTGVQMISVKKRGEISEE